MKKPNGYGTIKRLSGRRRRPFMFAVTKDGKQVPVAYFETQVEAEIYQADYNKEHRQYNLPAHKVTFEELFYRWLPVHIADAEPVKTTVYGYHNAFRHCAALYLKPVTSLRYMDFQRILDKMKKHKLSYSSLKKVRSLLSLLLKYAMECDIIHKNYAALLKIGKNKPVRPHKPFTRQQINKLWNCALPGADTVLILLYTGLRVGELLSLEKKNVNLRNRTISVVKSKTAAGIRTVPIHSRILPLIQQRMSAPGAFLIADDSGKPYNYSRYCTLWNQIMKQLKLKHTTHDCRHTVATLLDNADANENAKRRILGHASGDITDRVYTHKNIRQLRKTIQLLI